MILNIGRNEYEVESLSQAQKVYEDLRDASEMGASGWPNGFVSVDGKRIARISYNGRLWSPDCKTPLDARPTITEAQLP